MFAPTSSAVQKHSSASGFCAAISSAFGTAPAPIHTPSDGKAKYSSGMYFLLSPAGRKFQPASFSGASPNTSTVPMGFVQNTRSTCSGSDTRRPPIESDKKPPAQSERPASFINVRLSSVLALTMLIIVVTFLAFILQKTMRTPAQHDLDRPSPCLCPRPRRTAAQANRASGHCAPHRELRMRRALRTARRCRAAARSHVRHRIRNVFRNHAQQDRCRCRRYPPIPISRNRLQGK